MPTFETRLAALAALGVLARRLRPDGDRRRLAVAGAGDRRRPGGHHPAPPGFCIDAPSTRVDAAGAFVLMGDCALLGTAPGRPGGAALTAASRAAG